MRKKRDLVLDFTSLLDVIMILLFVVICSMNHAAMEANENAKAANNKLDYAKEQLEENEAVMEELKADNAALKSELMQFAINGEETSIDMAEAYGLAIDNTVKVVLECDTGMDIATNNHIVLIDARIKGEDIETTHKELTIVHDFSLDKDERARFNARQVKNICDKLNEALSEVHAPLIWFMVEYEYKDENFSNADLEILREAIDDLSLMLDIRCQIEEIKK